jgi:hypothetical protein
VKCEKYLSVCICFVSEGQITQLVGQVETEGSASLLVLVELDSGRYGTFYATEKQKFDIYKQTFPKIFPLESSSVKFSI